MVLVMIFGVVDEMRWYGDLIEGRAVLPKRGQTQRAISLGMPTTAPARQKA
jgi:hypothetical protein